MPQIVELPNGDTIEFPDDMSQETMLRLVDNEFGPQASEIKANRAQLQAEMEAERARLGPRIATTLSDIGEKAAYAFSTLRPRELAQIPENIAKVAGVIPMDAPYAVETPIIPPEAIVDPLKRLIRPLPDSFGEALTEFAGETAAGMTSPLMASSLVAAGGAPVAAGRIFQGEMLAAVPESIQYLAEAAPGKETYKAGLGVAANIGFPVLIERGIRRMENLPRTKIAAAQTFRPEAEARAEAAITAAEAEGRMVPIRPTEPIPETPPPRPATPARVPVEVPGTPAEPYQAVLGEIRSAEARTIRQIQELFPQAQLSREQARILRNQAWPEGQILETRQPAPSAEPIRPEPPRIVEEAPVAPEPVTPVPEIAPQVPKAAPQVSKTTDPVGNTESFYALINLRNLAKSNDPRLANAYRFYGVKTVPELNRAATERFARTGKEPSVVPKIPEPAVPPVTAPSETVRPAEAVSPAPAEPSIPISTPEVGIQQPPTPPRPFHSAAFPPAAVTRAGAQIVGKGIEFYSQPLIERLRNAGGVVARGFANMANEITQRSKALFGSLTDTLDPALEATGTLGKATTWLNDIAPTTRRWGYRNAVQAVEGPIGNVPAYAVDAVNKLKTANLSIGQLPQGVVPGFKATGKYQRQPTEFLVDTIRAGRGPAYELLVQALSSENGIAPLRVRRLLADIKAEFDAPGSQQTVHRIAQEFERHFKKFPTDLKIQTPVGDVWMPILHAKPFDYLQKAATSTAQRVAFLERIPQGTLGQLRQSVVRELKGTEPFDDLVRAMHGLPINEPLRWFPPGSLQGMMASGINRVLTDIFAPLKLSLASIYNASELVLGNTPTFFGWKNTLRGAGNLMSRTARNNLEVLGAINKHFYNFSIDPKAPWRSLTAGFQQGLRKVTLNQFFNEAQEKLAAATAQVFGERAKGGLLNAREKALFEETADAMGFDRRNAKQMAEGRGTQEQYDNFTRRAASFATGGNIQLAEGSRVTGNRVLTSLFRFQSYPVMKMNAARQAWGNAVEALESARTRNVNPLTDKRVQASSEQLAKFLFGTAAQGAASAFLAALITGRGGGVEGVAKEAQDNPALFVLDSMAAGMAGPISAINYSLKDEKLLSVLDPRNINLGATFPGSIYLELKQMFNREKGYAGMTLSQAMSHYLKTKVPIGKAIRHALSETGLVDDEGKRITELYRLHDKWMEDNTDPRIRQRFERQKELELPTSEYRPLLAAIDGKDEKRMAQAIAELRETKKDKDIMERMNPTMQHPRFENLRTQKPLFMESKETEAKFKQSLTPAQLKLYNDAIENRRKEYQLFLKVWRQRPARKSTKASTKVVTP